MLEFQKFFKERALGYMLRAIRLALDEDGLDLTSKGLFSQTEQLHAVIISKQQGITIAGLPLASLILNQLAPAGGWSVQIKAKEGDKAANEQVLLEICGAAPLLLQAERVILNFISRACGIASLTSLFVSKLKNSKTRLLDTRKTMPGLRYLDKYAVLVGGGMNHRIDLEEMLMLKDTHLDQAGSIQKAVQALRDAYTPCPPIEVECRNLDEIEQAITARADRIMFDNMDVQTMRQALKIIPDEIETEISGGVTLDNISELGQVGADFISTGTITHSVPNADLSMRVKK